MIGESQFDCIAALQKAILADLAQWSEPRLRHKPSPTEWSALEVVDHLARTDAGITAQMRENLAAPLHLTLAHRAAGKAFNIMFRSPVRVKTPAAVSSILPDMPPDLATAAAAWNSSTFQLQAFLASLEAIPEGGVFAHPVAGPMSLSTALDFIETHTRHHVHQLDRLRTSAIAVSLEV